MLVWKRLCLGIRLVAPSLEMSVPLIQNRTCTKNYNQKRIYCNQDLGMEARNLLELLQRSRTRSQTVITGIKAQQYYANVRVQGGHAQHRVHGA